MNIAANRYYIANKGATNKVSWAIANAMATELACYNIGVSRPLMEAIASNTNKDAMDFCKQVLKDYTVGKLNPPLFKNWENRTYFSFDEMIVQIFGYILQISGNDLESEGYMENILSKVQYAKAKTLQLVTLDEALEKFHSLVDVKVSLDKKAQATLQKAGAEFADVISFYNKRIYSDEARIAVLMGLLKSVSLYTALGMLKCKPADVLRYAAALHDFGGVKLPYDVIYGKLSWADRVDLLRYLHGYFEYDELMEAMGNNREAWNRFFKHIHIFQQKGFVNRFPYVGVSARVSCGHKMDSFPSSYVGTLKALEAEGVIEVLPTSNTVYRTFASRITSAIEEKSFDKIYKLLNKNAGYLLRNLASVSNGIRKKDEKDFVGFVRTKLNTASADVLFSILSLDMDAEYRVIDVKGDTVIQPANYPKVIGDIQGDICRVINERWGYKGKVIVEDGLENNIVPFLDKNTNLQRGTRIPFEDKDSIYFFMHWIQSAKCRTDLDSSYIAFDNNWNSTTIYYGNQANYFLTHGGDITNAPAPNGATEYGRIRLDRIPHGVQYIVPIINVFTGEPFSDLKEAYAGFMFSNSNTFKIEASHVRYDLTNPANFNVPFIVDVKNREIIVMDYNSRTRIGFTAHSEIDNMKKLISAVQTKNYITIQKLADMLSGDSDEVSLEIRKSVRRDDEIAPESLATLFK